MTRLASILGVATVATLVLLSGCEQAVTTDYAKDLEGTWKVTIEDRDLPNPAGPTPTVPGMSAVTAEVTRTGTNKGTVSLTIVDTPTAVPAAAQTTEVTGTIEVTADDISVSDVAADPPTVLAALPPAVAAGLTLTYTLADDGSELTVGNAALFTALLGVTEVKLTKETASTTAR